MALCRARSLGETRAGEGVNVHVSRVQGERPDEMSALKIWQRGLFDVVLLVRRRGSSTLACAWFFPFCNYEITVELQLRYIHAALSPLAGYAGVNVA